MKFLKFLDARSFGLQAAERRFEILKFLGAKRFGLRTTTGFLKFTPMPSNNGSEILKFTPVPRNRFGILKFTLAPRKCKPASAVRLNFAFNSVPHARAAKFKRDAR